MNEDNTQVETSEVGSTVEASGVQVETSDNEVNLDELFNWMNDLGDDDTEALFKAVLKVDALERGANGWKFDEAERTVIGKAQSAARLAGL